MISSYSAPGGGGIGAAAPNHAVGDQAAGPGGAGLNEARINNISYNFKRYFANNNTFGDISGYIGGGGSGISSATQSPGGIGGGGMGQATGHNFALGYINQNGKLLPTSGAANTGSGGGGGDIDGGDIKGGSGIVIIRYRS
jgi:hypothetical protein